MFKPKIIAASILLSMTIASPVLAEDNTEIKRADVPSAAISTAEYYAPGVFFTRYAYEDENGVRIYEFEGTTQMAAILRSMFLQTERYKKLKWKSAGKKRLWLCKSS